DKLLDQIAPALFGSHVGPEASFRDDLIEESQFLSLSRSRAGRCGGLRITHWSLRPSYPSRPSTFPTSPCCLPRRAEALRAYRCLAGCLSGRINGFADPAVPSTVLPGGRRFRARNLQCF